MHLEGLKVGKQVSPCHPSLGRGRPKGSDSNPIIVHQRKAKANLAKRLSAQPRKPGPARPGDQLAEDKDYLYPELPAREVTRFEAVDGFEPKNLASLNVALPSHPRRRPTSVPTNEELGGSLPWEPDQQKSTDAVEESAPKARKSNSLSVGPQLLKPMTSEEKRIDRLARLLMLAQREGVIDCGVRTQAQLQAIESQLAAQAPPLPPPAPSAASLDASTVSTHFVTGISMHLPDLSQGIDSPRASTVSTRFNTGIVQSLDAMNVSTRFNTGVIDTPGFDSRDSPEASTVSTRPNTALAAAVAAGGVSLDASEVSTRPNTGQPGPMSKLATEPGLRSHPGSARLASASSRTSLRRSAAAAAAAKAFVAGVGAQGAPLVAISEGETGDILVVDEAEPSGPALDVSLEASVVSTRPNTAMAGDSPDLHQISSLSFHPHVANTNFSWMRDADKGLESPGWRKQHRAPTEITLRQSTVPPGTPVHQRKRSYLEKMPHPDPVVEEMRQMQVEVSDNNQETISVIEFPLLSKRPERHWMKKPTQADTGAVGVTEPWAGAQGDGRGAQVAAHAEVETIGEAGSGVGSGEEDGELSVVAAGPSVRFIGPDGRMLPQGKLPAGSNTGVPTRWEGLVGGSVCEGDTLQQASRQRRTPSQGRGQTTGRPRRSGSSHHPTPNTSIRDPRNPAEDPLPAGFPFRLGTPQGDVGFGMAAGGSRKGKDGEVPHGEALQALKGQRKEPVRPKGAWPPPPPASKSKPKPKAQAARPTQRTGFQIWDPEGLAAGRAAGIDDTNGAAQQGAKLKGVMRKLDTSASTRQKDPVRPQGAWAPPPPPRKSNYKEQRETLLKVQQNPGFQFGDPDGVAAASGIPDLVAAHPHKDPLKGALEAIAEDLPPPPAALMDVTHEFPIGVHDQGAESATLSIPQESQDPQLIKTGGDATVPGEAAGQAVRQATRQELPSTAGLSDGDATVASEAAAQALYQSPLGTTGLSDATVVTEAGADAGPLSELHASASPLMGLAGAGLSDPLISISTEAPSESRMRTGNMPTTSTAGGSAQEPRSPTHSLISPQFRPSTSTAGPASQSPESLADPPMRPPPVNQPSALQSTSQVTGRDPKSIESPCAQLPRSKGDSTTFEPALDSDAEGEGEASDKDGRFRVSDSGSDGMSWGLSGSEDGDALLLSDVPFGLLPPGVDLDAAKAATRRSKETRPGFAAHSRSAKASSDTRQREKMDELDASDVSSTGSWGVGGQPVHGIHGPDAVDRILAEEAAYQESLLPPPVNLVVPEIQFDELPYYMTDPTPWYEGPVHEGASGRRPVWRIDEMERPALETVAPPPASPEGSLGSADSMPSYADVDLSDAFGDEDGTRRPPTAHAQATAAPSGLRATHGGQSSVPYAAVVAAPPNFAGFEGSRKEGAKQPREGSKIMHGEHGASPGVISSEDEAAEAAHAVLRGLEKLPPAHLRRQSSSGSSSNSFEAARRWRLDAGGSGGQHGGGTEGSALRDWDPLDSDSDRSSRLEPDTANSTKVDPLGSDSDSDIGAVPAPVSAVK